MTSKEFIIWLDGYLQGNGDVGLTTMQVRDIINKISEVRLDDEIKKEIIFDRINTPMDPIRIQEPTTDEDMDFPGKPPKIYM